MDNEVTSLTEFKDKKVNKKISEDINKILTILETIQIDLLKFRMYKPVQEIISIIETNKVLFHLKKKAYEKNSEPSKS